MARLIAVILAALLLAGCRPTPAEVGEPRMDKYAVGYLECKEIDADTVLVVAFTLRDTVTGQEWPIPLKLTRLVDENDNLVMVGGRFGAMKADGISPRTGKPMGFAASVGLAEPFGTPLDPYKPRTLAIRTAFDWTNDQGRNSSLEKVFNVRIGQPDTHVLSEDVTVTVKFRPPVKK
jgi:hypothetical protein